MARPLRVHFAGALYHVMSRGIERRRIVRDDGDRQTRLDWLRRTANGTTRTTGTASLKELWCQVLLVRDSALSAILGV